MALKDLIIHAGNIVTKKVDSSVFEWMLQVSDTLDAGGTGASSNPSGNVRTSLNTMTEPHFELPEWLAQDATVKLASQETMTTGTLNDGVWINPDKNTGGTGRIRQLYLLPGDSGTFTMLAKMPTGVANNTVSLRVYDGVTNAILFQSPAILLTQAIVTISIAQSNAVAGKMYIVELLVNEFAQQCNPMVQYGAMKPALTGSGLFAKDFLRIGLDQSTATHNDQQGWNGGSYAFTDAYAEWILNTNSNVMAFEAFALNSDGVCWLLKNGNPWIKGTAFTVNNSRGFQIVNIPAPETGKQFNTITLRAGAGAGPVSNVTTPGGTFPVAIYLPASADYSMLQADSDESLVYLGDSIGNGSLATNIGFQGGFTRIRRDFQGESINKCYNSQALFNYLGPGNDPAKQFALAWNLVGESKPKITLIDLGVNDKVNNLWTAADFEVALTALLVNMLQLNPQGLIFVKSPGITTVEGANGLGSTMPNYRTACSNAVTTVADVRVVFVDGLGPLFYVAGDLVDTVHPNAAGQGKLGNGWRSALALSSTLGPEL